MLKLSKPTRRSSAGSSLSSLSPDEENPTRISRQFSLTEPNQRLTKDALARVGNRQTKVINHAREKEKFNWRRWGSSLTGLRTLDLTLGPPSTPAEFVRRTCLRGEGK